jgi:CRISPR-associated protein Cas5h
LENGTKADSLNKLLIFDVWAPFAYFRKGFTTTTALTYPFIPRSAVEGLVGAIIGLKSEEYPEKLECAKIAVRIMNKVKKTPFSMMHTHVDAWRSFFGPYLRTGAMPISPKTSFRARVKVEFLHDPKFRVYFSHTSDVQESILEKLTQHETMFTPYLGTSSMLANFEYIGEYSYAPVSAKEPVHVSSIIPFIKDAPKIHIEDGMTYAFEQNIPIHITASREVMGFFDAAYSPLGSKIKVSGVEVQTVDIGQGQEHVIFLPTEIPS